MASIKLTYLVILISMFKRTCQSESLTTPCKSVLVHGAERYGCDGLYKITTQITPKWSKGKPVYENTDKKRYIYFINPFYGWVLSSEKGLQNYMYYYASRLDSCGPTMGVWRPMRNKSRNITVVCQDLADIQFLISSSSLMYTNECFNRNMCTIICVLSLLLVV